MSIRLKSHIALFLVALIYGANYTIAKIVMDDGYIEPLGFILMRVLCGLILFNLFHFLFIRESIQRKDIIQLILCGIFGVAINQMFFFKGLQLTTPINGSLIMTTCPIIVLISGAIILKEKITIKKLIGITIGASGAIILILNGNKLNFQSDQFMGDLMIFVNAVSFGIYLVLVRSLMKTYHPITVVKWVFIFGSIIVFPFGIGELKQVEWQYFPTEIWLAITYVLLATTFLAYLLNAFALKNIQASTVSAYIYLQPLLAALIAVIVASDKLAPIKILAGLLIFLGVYLVSSSAKSTPK